MLNRNNNFTLNTYEFSNRLRALKIDKLREIAKAHNLHYHISLKTRNDIINGILNFYTTGTPEAPRTGKYPQILKTKYGVGANIFTDKDNNIKLYKTDFYSDKKFNDVDSNLEFFKPDKPKEKKPRKSKQIKQPNEEIKPIPDITKKKFIISKRL